MTSMMTFRSKALIGLAFMLSLTACGEPVSRPDTAYDGMPPARFRGDTDARIKFVSNIEAACYEAGLKRMAGTTVNACTVQKGNEFTIIFPNPCVKTRPSTSGKQNLCHEIGHVNGWPSDHSE